MKIVTELIRMLIFYEDYDTNKNKYANTLYYSSETNRKIIDSIIINIKECINMLKNIDISLWDGIINKLYENMKDEKNEKAMMNLEKTIKKLNL
jgi:hypothetical protein